MLPAKPLVRALPKTIRAAHRRRLLVAAVASTLAAVATGATGCNGILGIDDRTLAEDTTGLSCQNYCNCLLYTSRCV